MVRRRYPAVLMLVVLLATLARPQVTRAATPWIWPGPGPCNTTLQACVTNAASGDTVLVAQNGSIDEQVSIVNKSLTLTAQSGFHPLVRFLLIQKSAGDDAVNVTVAHIGVAQSILISLDHGPGSVVTLDHVSAVGSSADPGIYGNIYVKSTVNVLHSTVTQTGFYAGIELMSPVSHADLTYNVIGNRVSGHGNAISSSGIYLSVTDADSLKANVYNNVIWDVGRGASSPSSSGIYLYSRDSERADFNVVGNTIDHITHNAGIFAQNEQDAGHRFSVDLFDNIVAHTDGSAVQLTSQVAGTFRVRGGQNDFYKNGHTNHTEGHSLGSNLSVSPGFVDPQHGDVRLQPSSAVIDKGLVCTPGGIAGPDRAGKNRLHGSSVDIGAYEQSAGTPGLVLLGTSGRNHLDGASGNDILCGYGDNDVLRGGGGSDYIDGGTEDDHLYGGSAHDRLYGRAGTDKLCANDGAGGDYLDGGPGTDSRRADDGDVQISVEKLGNC
jgi:RTX calcium-binding nonapeptide repeat (4 copies)